MRRDGILNPARLRLLATLPLALCWWIGCSRPTEPLARVRVAGRPGSAPTTAVSIDGTQRRVLVPARAEHVFLLDDLPARPLLALAIGRRSGDPASAIRFEAWLKPAQGEPISLYAHELTEPGWVDGSVDLSAHPLQGARLVLRVSGTRGPEELLRDAVWGEPVVLSATPPAHPSAILVSIDSLRADRVGVYGSQETHTPVLDAFAREGAWYDQAYTSSTWTAPSHTCLLYGMTFGTLFHNCQYSCAPATPEPVRPLPEILRQKGYLTAGFTGGGFVSPNFGFGRGFDTYYSFRPPSPAQPGCSPARFDGPEVVARAADWLRRFGQAPFFLFLHTYDVHDDCPVKPPDLGEGFDVWPDPGPANRKQFIEYYDQQVTNVDRLLAGMLTVLERLGLADTTLVVITADHGQAFWEHGFQGHGCTFKPYGELARVPLLLRFPTSGWRPGRVSTPVSTVDIAPTILGGLGLPLPPWMEGAVLPGLGVRGEEPHPIYVQCGDVLGIRDGRYKLITSLSARFADEVYDLDADPAERIDVAGRGERAEEDLRARAAGYWRQAAGAELPKPMNRVDEETRARLRALGYLGHDAPSAASRPGGTPAGGERK